MALIHRLQTRDRLASPHDRDARATVFPGLEEVAEAPCRLGPYGLRQAGELGYLGVSAALAEYGQEPASVVEVRRRVHVSQTLLGQHRDADLAFGVAGGETGQEPLPAAVVEALLAHQQQASYPVERVVLAPAVAERGVLHPAANIVDRLVGQPNGVE